MSNWYRDFLREKLPRYSSGGTGQQGPQGPAGDDGDNAEAVLSVAPVDGYQVKNIYVDNTGATPKLAYEYDDALLGVNQNPGLIASNPPPGSFAQVINIWVEQGTGRLGFTYDDGL